MITHRNTKKRYNTQRGGASWFRASKAISQGAKDISTATKTGKQLRREARNATKTALKAAKQTMKDIKTSRRDIGKNVTKSFKNEIKKLKNSGSATIATKQASKATKVWKKNLLGFKRSDKTIQKIAKKRAQNAHILELQKAVKKGDKTAEQQLKNIALGRNTLGAKKNRFFRGRRHSALKKNAQKAYRQSMKQSANAKLEQYVKQYREENPGMKPTKDMKRIFLQGEHTRMSKGLQDIKIGNKNLLKYEILKRKQAALKDAGISMSIKDTKAIAKLEAGKLKTVTALDKQALLKDKQLEALKNSASVRQEMGDMRRFARLRRKSKLQKEIIRRQKATDKTIMATDSNNNLAKLRESTIGNKKLIKDYTDHKQISKNIRSKLGLKGRLFKNSRKMEKASLKRLKEQRKEALANLDGTTAGNQLALKGFRTKQATNLSSNSRKMTNKLKSDTRFKRLLPGGKNRAKMERTIIGQQKEQRKKLLDEMKTGESETQAGLETTEGIRTNMKVQDESFRNYKKLQEEKGSLSKTRNLFGRNKMQKKQYKDLKTMKANALKDAQNGKYQLTKSSEQLNGMRQQRAEYQSLKDQRNWRGHAKYTDGSISAREAGKQLKEQKTALLKRPLAPPLPPSVQQPLPPSKDNVFKDITSGKPSLKPIPKPKIPPPVAPKPLKIPPPVNPSSASLAPAPPPLPVISHPKPIQLTGKNLTPTKFKATPVNSANNLKSVFKRKSESMELSQQSQQSHINHIKREITTAKESQAAKKIFQQTQINKLQGEINRAMQSKDAKAVSMTKSSSIPYLAKLKTELAAMK